MEATQEYLKSRIRYCPATGLFFRRFKKGEKLIIARHKAHGNTDYVKIRFAGKKYYGHRLAWLYMTGEFPDGGIDHADRNGLNNAWQNLRLASASQQRMNAQVRADNTSGFKGVHLHKPTGKWLASIGYKGERKHLGLYATPDEAGKVYLGAAKILFGEFSHLGQ